MRPMFVTAILSMTLLSAAACSDKSPDKPGSTPTGAGPSASSSAGTTASPGSGPVVGGVDKKTVCAGYEKAVGEAQAKLQVILPQLAEAMGSPSKAGPVVTELKTVITTFETAIAAEAARSQDAELRAAIEADLAAWRQAGKDAQAAGADAEKALAALQTPEFTKAGEKVRSLCEK